MDIRNVLLFLFAISFAAVPELHAQGRDDKEALALYQSLVERAAHPSQAVALRIGESASSVHPSTCGTSAIAVLEHFMNTHDLSEPVRELFIQATQPNSPNLPSMKETAHVMAYYTTADQDTPHNVTDTQVDAILASLESSYTQYVKAFGDLQLSNGTKIVLEIYSFHRLDAILQNAAGFTSAGPNPIALAAQLVREGGCKIEETAAHELFHRVQYGHGMAPASFPEEPLFVEGLAEWAPTLIDPGYGDIIDFINTYFVAPVADAFVKRSYESAHFWTFLDERFQEFAGKRAKGRVIDSILNAYKKANHSKSLTSILQKSAAALLAVEDEKAKTKPSYKSPPFNRFLQEWHVTNFVKDYNVNSKKLGYNPFPLADKCGKQRTLSATETQGGGLLSDNDRSFSKQVTIPAGAPSYFSFLVKEEVTKLAIEASAGSKFSATVIGLNGSKVKLARSSFDKKNSFPLKLKPGQIDTLLVILSAPLEYGVTATLKINDSNLSGRWFSDEGLIGFVTLKEDKKANSITGKQDGGYKLQGSRVDDKIVIRACNTFDDGEPFCGTYTFVLCPSGKTLMGVYLDDSAFEDGDTVGDFAYWCRFNPREDHEDENCVPPQDEDETCKGIALPPAQHP